MSLVCVNGSIIEDYKVHISPLCLGTAYGYGLFETLLILRGKPVFFDEHIKRLNDSAEFFNIKVFSKEAILEWLMNLINVHKVCNGRARIMLTATDKALNNDKLSSKLFITVSSCVPYAEENYARGARLGFLSFTRNSNSIIIKHKTINYLENIMGQQHARMNNWDEALFLNSEGFIAEGTKSNIFLVVGNNKLITPDVESGILPGITRAKIIEIATKEGFTVMEKKVSIEELASAEECFICNSLMGIMPVSFIMKSDYGFGGRKFTKRDVVTFLRSKYLHEINNSI